MGLQSVLILLTLVVLALCENSDAFLAPRERKTRISSKNPMWNPFAATEPSGSSTIDAILTREPASIRAALARSKSAVNEKDSKGSNAMHVIAKLGHYKFPPEPEDSIPKILIQAGLDINEKDGNNRTALEIALLSGWQRIAYLLLEKGADRSVVTQDVKSRITCPDCKRVVKEYNL